MKRILNAICTILFTLSLLFQLYLFPTAQAAEPVSLGNSTSAQVIGDTLYALMDGQIIAYATPQSAPTTLLSLSDYPEISPSEWDYLSLLGDGASLYLFSPVYGRLYQVEGSTLRLLVQLDISGLGRETAIPGYYYVLFSHPLLMNRALYLLSMDLETFQDYELYRFPLDTGKPTRIDLGTMCIDEITPYKNGQLLTIDRNTSTLVALTPDGSGHADILTELPGVNDRGVAYCEADDTCYFLSGFQLMRYRGNFEQVTTVPFDDMSLQTYPGIWQGKLVAQTTLGLYPCEINQTEPVQPSPDTLRIWANSNLLTSEDIAFFRASHPDIPVEVQVNPNDDPMERLMNESLSRDASIDIFLLSSYMIDSQLIFQRGFAAPIASEALQERVQTMYPQVQELLTRDGTLYGYPLDLWPDFWTVRPELLEKAGLGKIPQTMEAYVDMLLRWYEMYADAYPGYTFNGVSNVRAQQLYTAQTLLLTAVHAHAVQDEPLSFRTPLLTGLLEKLSTLSQYEGSEVDLLEDMEVSTASCIFKTGKSVIPFNRSLNPSSLGEVCMDTPLLAPGDEPANGASMDYLIINPNSKHMKEALAFLESYSQRTSLVGSYLLAPGMNEPVENEAYEEQVAELQSQIAMLKKWIQQQEKTVGILTSLMEGMLEEADEYQELQTELDEAQAGLTDDQDQLAECEAALRIAENTRYTISAQDIAEYRAVAQHMSLKNHHLAWEITEELDVEAMLTRYFEGYASLEQTLGELDKRVAMMFYEAQ